MLGASVDFAFGETGNSALTAFGHTSRCTRSVVPCDRTNTKALDFLKALCVALIAGVPLASSIFNDRIQLIGQLALDPSHYYSEKALWCDEYCLMFRLVVSSLMCTRLRRKRAPIVAGH